MYLYVWICLGIRSVLGAVLNLISVFSDLKKTFLNILARSTELVTLFSDRFWVSISSTDIMPNSTCDKLQIRLC